MARPSDSTLSALIEKHHEQLLQDWTGRQTAAVGPARLDSADLKEHSRRFLTEFRKGAQAGVAANTRIAPEWASTREALEEISRTRALAGFTPSDIATFVFSLKEPLFTLLRQELGKDPAKLADEIWSLTLLIDALGLYVTELAQKNRDQVITRQQQELLELSTPVVELWDGVLAVPLIGTLDSERTQVVMESLLERIVTSRAEIAIIDITGVPTVDTLVAQHLIKTVSAARLMGADCIISGIRPQIAQTIVHLGLELNVISKATMADAFALALRRSGKMVVSRNESAREPSSDQSRDRA